MHRRIHPTARVANRAREVLYIKSQRGLKDRFGQRLRRPSFETAEIGDIVVALVENENTLKRLEYNERRKRYYLHPENETMEDIYVENLSVQGVAVKVLKDLV